MNRTTSAQSLGTALRKVESYQYPATHLGHLSASQSKALQDFEKLAEQKGYFTPASDTVPASHDDETMLRYLRARKFVPEEAFKQFKETEDWRKKEKIDELYETIDIQEYDETRRLYPQWTGRRDKRGIPVYVFEVAHLTAKRMSAYEKSIAKSTKSGQTPAKFLRLFALYENLLKFAMPLCSAVPNRPYKETPVSQSNNIVDISGVGLKQFWNLRQHMQDASQLATAHYPETLDRIFIIGAPSFFPTVWSWVKGWFDPITVSKIFILSKEDMKQTLNMYIDSANIPVKYGGALQWEWGSLPALEPAIDDALDWHNPEETATGTHAFPNGPIKWMKDESGLVAAVAVGSENGQRRKRTIATIKVQKDLALGPLETQVAAMSTADNGLLGVSDATKDPMFGHPSTTGEHTHPAEGQEYFPTTGVTPPSEPEESLNEQTSGVPAPKESIDEQTSSVPAPKESIDEQNFSVPAPKESIDEQNSSVPASRGSSSTYLSYSNATTLARGQQESSIPHTNNSEISSSRQGTSAARYEQQSATHADGQLQDDTPDVRDNGYGDKTAIMEPSTVGQAHKAVDIPEATPPTDSQPQPGYVEQAQDAVVGVAAAAGGVGSAILAKVGLGGTPAEQGAIHETQPEPEKTRQDDPRIDSMENKDVEEFIRSQYTTKKQTTAK